MSVPEHIENIHKVLNIRIDDLAELFDVSYKTIYKWMSGNLLPKIESQNLIIHSSKISEQFTESNISRPDLLIDVKYFDDRSLIDLIRSGEVTEKHVETLVEKDRIMEQAYQEFRRVKSKSTPTDDWKSSISIPGTIGNY